MVNQKYNARQAYNNMHKASTTLLYIQSTYHIVIIRRDTLKVSDFSFRQLFDEIFLRFFYVPSNVSGDREIW